MNSRIVKLMQESVLINESNFIIIPINGFYFVSCGGIVHGFSIITNGLIDDVIERFRPPIDRGTPTPFHREEEEHDHDHEE